MYRQVQERENLAELALELRYTLNAKSVKKKKLSKEKDRLRIERAFGEERRKRAVSGSSNDFAERIERLNAHFRNR